MAEARAPRSVLREAQRTARRLMVDGVPWLVYELPATRFDRRQSPSLLFESDSSVRRVRNFPADWRSLSDQELFAVSWSV
jgi:hypothetical protein